MRLLFAALVELDFPVLTPDNVYSLEFVKAAAAVNNTVIQRLVQTLKNNTEWSYLRLWVETVRNTLLIVRLRSAKNYNDDDDDAMMMMMMMICMYFFPFRIFKAILR